MNPFQIQATVDEIMKRSRTRFGHGLFFMEGEEATTEEATTEEATTEEATADDAKVDLSKLPQDVQAMVKRYRKEAAEASGKARDEAKTKAAKDAQDALMADIGKKLGFIKDDQQLTPEEFQRKLTEESQKTTTAQDAAREKDVELAVYRSAGKAGGDPDALLDSRGFLAKLKDLDPSKSDFRDKVTAAIKEAVKDNPKLKLQAGAGSSSADHGSGGSGEGGTRKPVSLDQAVGGHYGV